MDRLYDDKLGSVELALVERSLPEDVAEVLIALTTTRLSSRHASPCERWKQQNPPQS